MNPKEAYKHWAHQYDTNENKTRDLEEIALRETLADIKFDTCLELGCGTGKNTMWLISKAKKLTGVDLSEEMLNKASYKLKDQPAQFIQADINQPWTFTREQFDLVSFSLVLEHIENLEPIFRQAAEKTTMNGHVYVGELHPFKQYAGSKARFENESGLHIVTCFNHHVSEFLSAARKYGLELAAMNEYFDNDGRAAIPRILALLFRKNIV